MKLLLLYTLILLASCNPLKKAVRVMDEHPAAAALYCADRFPVRDSVIVRDSVSYDTLYEAGDTLYIPSYDSFHVVKYITPPAKIITKTVRRDSLIIRRDVARETVLRNQADVCYENGLKKDNKIAGLQSDLGEMKKKRNWWRIACLVTWALIGLGVVWKVRSKLPI